MIVAALFLFALYDNSDSNHLRALDEFETISEPLTVTHRVLEELITVLTYKQGVDFALSVLEQTKSNDAFDLFPTEMSVQKEVLELMKKTRKNLSFTDYSLVYLSIQRGETVLTYDKQMLGLLKKKKIVKKA